MPYGNPLGYADPQYLASLLGNPMAMAGAAAPMSPMFGGILPALLASSPVGSAVQGEMTRTGMSGVVPSGPPQQSVAPAPQRTAQNIAWDRMTPQQLYQASQMGQMPGMAQGAMTEARTRGIQLRNYAPKPTR